MNLSYTLPKAEENIIAGVKLHTFREDKTGRWKPGFRIHHCYSFRSKNGYKCFFQNECVSTQNVLLLLLYRGRRGEEVYYSLSVVVDRKELTQVQIEALVVNDGFRNREQFIEWFFPDKYSNGERKRTMWAGKIIHWTNLKY